jgi:dipeptidyl aminopeptidase/acylaminoacyl peptidase
MSTRRLIITLCLTFFYLLTESSGTGQRRLAPLPVKEALKTLNLSMFTPLDLSSDGKLVAYVLQDTNRKARTKTPRSAQDLEAYGIPSRADYCDIWISDTGTGVSRNLTQGKGTSWAPVWSPNGKYLAFYTDRDGLPGLWIWERASGTMRKASSAIVRTRTETSIPRWTPDSKKLVIRVLPKSMSIEGALRNKPENNSSSDADKEPGSTVVLFSSRTATTTPNENNNVVVTAADLAVVDLETKETKHIASHVTTVGDWLSPDGTNVAVLNFKRRVSQSNLQSLFDLLVVSLVDGRSRTLVTDFGSDLLIPVSWSPDGKFLAYMTAGPTTQNDCWVVPLASGEPRNVTPGEHPRFDSTFLYRGPLWDAAGENIYLLSSTVLWRTSMAEPRAEQIATIPGRTLRHIISQNGRTIWTPKADSIIVVTRADQNRQEGFYQINLSTGEPEKLLEENKSYGFVPPLRIAVSADQQHLIYTSQSASESEDIWTTAAGQFRPKRVTNINPVFDQYVMGQGRLIEWQTLNGQLVHGALLLPAVYTPGNRYPLIVYQYPGSMWSTHGNLFGFNPFSSAVENWQFFATRGYAVLLADVPARPETYMRDIAAAILPAVDKVVDLGICDPNRVGITGQSNGGYGVLSLIVQTNRFKAAVDRMGPGNLISQYTQMSETGASIYTAEMLQRTGGSLWEKRDKFIENSPIFYFDKVETPLLIIQGTADRQVMAARSDEVFVSLRFLGKEVEYARYVGESHGVSDWGFANQVDYLNRVIAWFDRRLNSESQHLRQSSPSNDGRKKY